MEGAIIGGGGMVDVLCAGSSWRYSDHLHEAGQIDSRQVVRLVEILENGKDEEKKPFRGCHTAYVM